MPDQPTPSFNPDPADNPGASPDPDESAQRNFEIWFFEGVLQKSPAWVEPLRLLGGHYTSVGRFADGLAVDRRLVRLCPDDPVAHYNLACSLSLLGKVDPALEALADAVRLGYDDLAHMQRDPDLDNLRSHPDYASLVVRLKRP